MERASYDRLVAAARVPVQQRSRETHRRLLTAAVDCLVAGGYAGASTTQVQERAGISRGSLLHLFPSRDDLLVEAVAYLTRARAEHLRSDLTKLATGPQPIEDAVHALWSTFTGREFWASMELWMASRTRPELAGAVSRQERELGQLLRDLLGEIVVPDATGCADYSAKIKFLLSSMRGQAMTHAFERTTDPGESMLEMWSGVLRSIAPDTTVDRGQ